MTQILGMLLLIASWVGTQAFAAHGDEDFFAVLKDMASNQEFTDFNLVSLSNTKHPCHRLVLVASGGEYWRSMFNSGFIESQSSDISFPYSNEVIVEASLAQAINSGELDDEYPLIATIINILDELP